ncbi:hypothetical protein BDN72DRAFT_768086 [Pluteus cervinus]|uniref:Uncharacterized protein n=1 Tax=Pluteus cervinus TaxID=181527 RepID=A0ACD3AU87_9AGAR|nr:hypothetical protein BDN72DRAFT_768086 [Pluteus cervinus]
MSTGELSQTTYATRRKDLIAVIAQLRANGSQDDLDLPKIAVIGNQSAGKSSIVEAISGISVPRDGGTCTRCAFECRLSPAAEWSCAIKLRREFDAAGAPLKTEICEISFGSLIKEKGAVELRLRRAQVAVLMGETFDAKALVMSREEIKSLQEQVSTRTQGIECRSVPRFSKNTVCVHLRGPDYTDLEFVDLPGLIAAEDRETVEFVEDIVFTRIQGNCLILLTLPMSDDMMNQKALQLARQVDPTGQRTIGVLTKPDMLTSGSLDAHDFWVKVLSGAGLYPLERGYFCSKQPDDQQRRSGITPVDARKAEDDFFAKVEPWCKMGDTHIPGGVRLRDRFGLPRLVASLSDSLIEVIDQSLPQLEKSAKGLYDQSKQEYDKLPRAPSSEPFADVLQMITSFSLDVMTRVQSSGSHNPNQLIHQNRDAFSEFKKHIYGTRPRFLPYTREHCQKYGVKNVDSDEDNFRDQGLSDSTEEMQDGKMDLDDVRAYIASSTTRELPGNVPYMAKVNLITSVQATWQESTRACADAVRNSLSQTLHECAEHSFKGFPILHRLIKLAFTELVEKRFESCLERLNDTLETEQYPFTQNYHYLATSTEGWFSRHKEARARVHSQPLAAASAGRPEFQPAAAVPSPFQKNLNLSTRSALLQPPSVSVATLAPTNDSRAKLNALFVALADVGYHGLNEEDLARLNPPDEYETEMRVMAEVQGYFKVSFKRVIDNIPMLIDLKFVRAVAEDMQKFLVEKLDLGGEGTRGRCMEYLQQDPGVNQRREELEAKMKRMKSAQDELQRLKL